MPDTLYCWEENATCGSCEMQLRENQTIIFSEPQTNTMAVCAILISLLGSAITAFFLIALLQNDRARHQPSTPYIISLLFSDLLFSTTCLPMLASTYYNRQTGSFCDIFPVIFYTSLGAFILSLMMLTVNRTCFLVKQERAEIIMKPWVRAVAIFLCWAIPIFVMILPYSGAYGRIGLMNYTKTCTVVKDDQGESPENVLTNLFFFLPCTVMIICNIIMFVKIKLASSGTDRQSNIFITGLFVIFLFYVGSLIPNLILDHVDECFRMPGAHATFYILCWSGCIANPIMLVLIEKSFRDAIKAFFVKRVHLPLNESKQKRPKSESKMTVKKYRMKTFRAPKEAESTDTL